MRSRRVRLGFLVMVCVTLPHTVFAQTPTGDSDVPATPDTGAVTGRGGWRYAGLEGGPYVTYPSVTPRSFWKRAFHKPEPQVYGPIAGVYLKNDLDVHYEEHPGGFWKYSWFGEYAASPRPHVLSANPYPKIVNPMWAASPGVLSPPNNKCLRLAVRVPHASAELLVNGQPTSQTGVDRLFESPECESGKPVRYELIVRWPEGGVMVERKKRVDGKAGESVRIDFQDDSER